MAAARADAEVKRRDRVNRFAGRFNVASVDPGSAEKEPGLAVGGMILEVDGQPFRLAHVLGSATMLQAELLEARRHAVWLEGQRHALDSHAHPS